MRLRKLYPAMALVTFLIGLSASYSMHAVANRLLGFFTTGEVPQQELFHDATESRDVYSAILQQSFIRHRYRTVVIETTSANCLDRDFRTGANLTVQELYARERAIMPVDLDAVADYVYKNQTQGELFLEGLGIPNELIAREEAAKFFENGGGGWEAFYQRYPGSLGLVSFSKVGFNSRHDQAFVYVATTCHWLCGNGEYIVLDKEGGRWMVKVVQEIWES